MTTVFDIKTIQVMIYTNDPQNRKIEMKGSIFGFDKVNAFFSDSVLYSSEALNELTEYDPVEKRRIFFDPDLFYSFLELSRSKNPTPDQTINIRGCNFKTMIDALFVVSFPVPKKVELDYNEYNCIDSTPDFLVKNIRSFFQKNAYTHISSKDKKYTVLRAKWPNRIQTNPDYAASLVQALNIYKKGKEGFKKLKTDTVSKLISELKSKIGDFKIDVTKDFHVFKTYTITGNGKIKEMVEKLNNNLIILQKDFYFYVYLWILYLSSKHIFPKNDYFYSNAVSSVSDVNIGAFYNSTLFNLAKFTSWVANVSEDLFGSITVAENPSSSISFSTPFPLTSITPNKLAQTYSIDNSIRSDIMKDFNNPSNIPDLISQNLFVQTNVTNDKSYMNGKSNFQGFQRFLIKFLKTSGFQIPNGLNATIGDGPTKTTFVKAVDSIKSIKDLGIAICEYGFNEKTGLYHKIRDLIETIDFFKDEFNKTVDLNTSIEVVKEIIEEFKVKIVRVNEFLEKKDQIKTPEIEKLFEELIKERKGIESSDIVETSRFQNTKKYRDPVWEKLYKEGWYKNFANSMLEITQLRRSSNNKINVALGESGKYIVSDLEILVNDNEEAGIDEINIGGNRSENLPSFGANIFCVLVGGEITDENRGAIRCPYSSNKIGSLLSRLWLKLPSNEDLRRTDFMDLTSAIKKAEQALKNKTKKNQNLKKEDGIRDLVKARGLDQYDDERLKQVLRKGGYEQGQGFFDNLFGQGDKPMAEAKVQAKVQAKVELSGDTRTFIQENINVIKNFDSTKSKESLFSADDIIDTDEQFIQYLTSKESHVIPILNEANKISKEAVPDEKQKLKITEDINTKISKYDLIIKNSTNNTKTKEYQDDETKKQKNYLDLYRATIMKNLLEAVLGELDKYSSSPREMTGSNIVNLSRGNPKHGGSRKRIFKKSSRKTLRKTYRK